MTILVVMGVSGSGKTTIARLLADRLEWDYAEGDDFHPEANVQKMASGHPLTDADRWPWLDEIAEWIAAHRAAGDSGIVTCSALKRSYRDVLRADDVVFVYLHGSRDVLAGRLGHRHGHFMPASLLDSQIATLEPPADDEQVIAADVAGSPSEITAHVLAELAGLTAHRA